MLPHLRMACFLVPMALAFPGCSSSDRSDSDDSGGAAGRAAGAGLAAAGASAASAGADASRGGSTSHGGAPTLAGGTASSASAGLAGQPSGAGGAPSGGSAHAAGSSRGGASAQSGGTSSGGTAAGAGLGGAVTAGATGAGTGGRSSDGGSAGRPSGGAGGSGGPNAGPITVWLAGDSTVANGNTPCPVGWGAEFDGLFDDRVTVTNRAVGGRSVRTWLYNVLTTMDSTGECELTRDASGEPTLQARWQEMLSAMKSGDYLLVQFGINDGSATCDRHVGLSAFKQAYGAMAEAAKSRGAQPIFVTPLSAIACTGATARGTRGEYVDATHDAGDQYDVPVIDLHARSVALYTSLGFCPVPGGDVSAQTGGAVGQFFCDDHTHLDRPGARQIAALVADALREQNIGLGSYLR